MNGTGIFRIVCFVLIALIVNLSNCAYFNKTPEVKDEYGCTIPPENVYKRAEITPSYGQRVLHLMVSGDPELMSDPETMLIGGELVQEQSVIDYIQCHAKKRESGDVEQLIYLGNLSMFLNTHPDPEKFIYWQQNYELHSLPQLTSKKEDLMEFGPSAYLYTGAVRSAMNEKQEKIAFLEKHYTIKVLKAEADLLRRGGTIEVECIFDPEGEDVKPLPLRLVAVMYGETPYVLSCHKQVNFEEDQLRQVVQLSGTRCFFVQPNGLYAKKVGVLTMLDINEDFRNFSYIATRQKNRIFKRNLYIDFAYRISNTVPLTFE